MGKRKGRKRGGGGGVGPYFVIDSGGGVGYGIAGGVEGQFVNLDNYRLTRFLLEQSPTISMSVEIVSRLFRSLRLELQDREGQAVEAHPLLDLFNKAPNPHQTAAELWGQIAEELVFDGECILRVWWLGGKPYMLLVWPANEVNTDWETMPGAGFTYTYAAGSGGTQGGGMPLESVTVDPAQPEILHIRMNVDTHRPMRSRSPWRGMASDVFSSIHASYYRSEFFRQGGSPRLVATVEPMEEGHGKGRKGREEMEKVMNSIFRSIKAGPGAWSSMRALPEGVKLEDMGTRTITDPVLTEAMRGVDERLLAVAGLPAISANNNQKSTYSNSRQQNAIIVRDAIRPRLEALIAAIVRDLLMPMGGDELMPVVDTDPLIQDEAMVHNRIILDRVKQGVITENEAREAFDMEPLDELEGDAMEPMPDDGDEPGDPDADPKGEDESADKTAAARVTA